MKNKKKNKSEKKVSYYWNYDENINFSIICRVTTIDSKVVKYESYHTSFREMAYVKDESFVQLENLDHYVGGYTNIDDEEGKMIFNRLEREYEEYYAASCKLMCDFNQKITCIFGEVIKK